VNVAGSRYVAGGQFFGDTTFVGGGMFCGDKIGITVGRYFVEQNAEYITVQYVGGSFVFGRSSTEDGWERARLGIYFAELGEVVFDGVSFEYGPCFNEFAFDLNALKLEVYVPYVREPGDLNLVLRSVSFAPEFKKVFVECDYAWGYDGTPPVYVVLEGNTPAELIEVRDCVLVDNTSPTPPSGGETDGDGEESDSRGSGGDAGGSSGGGGGESSPPVGSGRRSAPYAESVELPAGSGRGQQDRHIQPGSPVSVSPLAGGMSFPWWLLLLLFLLLLWVLSKRSKGR